VVKKLKSALKKLFENASALSPDPYSENKIFFVAPKNAKSSKFCLTGINFHVQNTLIELRKSSLKLEEVGFLEEYYSFYRNYFESKATSAFTIQTAFYALKGMKSQPDMIYLKDAWKSILAIDGSSSTLTYQVLGLMGSKGSVNKIIKTSMMQINNQKVSDITAKAKLESENS
jgi:hypothetical protein